jgi:uncharacterized alpha/beta hydrolase family protein
MKKIFLFIVILAFTAVIFAQTNNYTEIKISALPKNTTAWLKKNMSQGTIIKAAVGTENNAKIYFVQLEVKGDKRIMRFDKDGNLLGKGARDQDKNSPKPVPVTPAQQKTDPAQPAKK